MNPEIPRLKRFFFVAPRFHTNQVPVVRALTDRGHTVRFLVRYVGGVESHQLLKPDLVPLYRPWRRAPRALEQTQWQMPRLRWLRNWLWEYNPAVTIIRDVTAVLQPATKPFKMWCDVVWGLTWTVEPIFGVSE